MMAKTRKNYMAQSAFEYVWQKPGVAKTDEYIV